MSLFKSLQHHILLSLCANPSLLFRNHSWGVKKIEVVLSCFGFDWTVRTGVSLKSAFNARCDSSSWDSYIQRTIRWKDVCFLTNDLICRCLHSSVDTLTALLFIRLSGCSDKRNVTMLSVGLMRLKTLPLPFWSWPYFHILIHHLDDFCLFALTCKNLI